MYLSAGAYERLKLVERSVKFCKLSVVKSHLCKLPYLANLYKLH